MYSIGKNLIKLFKNEIIKQKGFSNLAIQGLQFDNFKVHELIKNIDINTLNLNLEDQNLQLKLNKVLIKLTIMKNYLKMTLSLSNLNYWSSLN